MEDLFGASWPGVEKLWMCHSSWGDSVQANVKIQVLSRCEVTKILLVAATLFMEQSFFFLLNISILTQVTLNFWALYEHSRARRYFIELNWTKPFSYLFSPEILSRSDDRTVPLSLGLNTSVEK